MALLILLAPALAQGNNVPDSPVTERQICFYVKGWGGGRPGHAFVQMIPKDNSQAGRPDLLYGHYPRNVSPFDWRGDIKWDVGTNWDWKICYPVSAARYNLVVNKINADRGAHPNWHLFTTNCVDWIQAVAGTGGITLPDSKAFWGSSSIDDPRVLAKSLRNAATGSVPNAYIVPNLFKTEAGRWSPACSTTGIADGAFISEQALAAMLNLTPHTETLPALTLVPGQTVTINVTGTTTTDAVVAIDWNTVSSTRSENTLSDSRTYSQPIPAKIQVIVVNSGAVNKFNIPVIPSLTTPGPGTVTINVPTPPAPVLGPLPDDSGPTLEREPDPKPAGAKPIPPPPPPQCPPGQTGTPPACVPSGGGVPAVSDFGLGALFLGLLGLGAVTIRRRRAT